MTTRKTPVAEGPIEAVSEAASDTTSTPQDGPAAAMPEAETVAAIPTEAATSPEPRRGLGVMGPILGGALAAVGGFGLSHFNVFGLTGSDDSAVITQLVERQDVISARQEADAALVPDLKQEITRLATQIAALEAVPASEPPDLSRLDDLEARLAVIEAVPAGGDASTAALAAKLADLERQVAALPSDGAGTAEMEAALARLAKAEADAQARAAEAAAMAEAAAQAQALEVLAAAVASGNGFDAELATVADPDLQAALAPHVAGVTTLAQLQADFPEAARATLLLARGNDQEAGWGERIMDFLGAQTGARSLTPREGDDPDAILSRAEFALGEGRLADALAELAALEPAVRAPMEAWITSAEARVAVVSALTEAM